MRLVRVASVFAGLALGGAVFGALAGAGVAVVLLGASGGVAEVGLGGLYAIAAGIGAACGLLLAPVASFAFMRRVPLWRLYVETTAATIVAGALTLRLDFSLPTTIAIAAGGFLLAGARLAYSFRHFEGAGRTASADLERTPLGGDG